MNTDHETPIEVPMRTDETGAAYIPLKPTPPPDDYPADAIAPRFDEQGRKFVPEQPMPGILSLPCGTADALALSRFWAETAAEAVRMGSTEGWTYAEMRSAHFLRIARYLQPACTEPFQHLTPAQLELFTLKYAKGAA